MFEEKPKIKLLYVEDDEETRRLTSTLLAKKVSDCITAIDGLDGLEKFKIYSPDIVVTDIVMPNIDGIDFIKSMREISGDTIIIVTSAYNDTSYMLDAIEAGISRYIIKPLYKINLNKVLDEAIELVKLRKAAIEKDALLKEAYYSINNYMKIIDKNIMASETDLLGKITYVSEFYAKSYGYHQDELIGKTHRILRDPDVDIKLYKELWKTVRNKKTWIGEFSNIAKDGTKIIRRNIISPKFNMHGEHIGYSQIGEDLTALRASENILLKQSKMALMGEMISAIAHQWRQPLSALAVRVQDIYSAFNFGELDSVYAEEFKNKSMEIIKHMSQTIEDFRNFFKPEKEIMVFSVDETIKATLSILTSQLKNNLINVQLKSDADSHFINGYPSELEQVLLIILSNAQDVLLERNIEKPEIHIASAFIDNKIQVTITDNGGGIPENIFDRIYEPYFTTKEPGKGTGIGLYMSREIIERHMDGKLYAKNTSSGACFILEFKNNTKRQDGYTK